MRKLSVLLIIFVFASCFFAANVYSQREELLERVPVELPEQVPLVPPGLEIAAGAAPAAKAPITFDRALSCHKCGRYKAPPLTDIEMTISAEVTTPIDNTVFVDYFPVDFTIIDTGGGTVSSYSPEYDKIEWDVSVTDKISRSYTLKSPELTTPPTDYYFQSELAGTKSDPWKVKVADPSPDNVTTWTSGSYIYIETDHYKLGVFNNTAVDYFGLIGETVISKDYDSSQHLAGNWIFEPIYFYCTAPVSYSLIGAAAAGIDGVNGIIVESGPERVVLKSTYTDTGLELYHYFYNEYWATRVKTTAFAGTADDGIKARLGLDDTNATGGGDSYGLRYAHGSKAGPTDTWTSAANGTYDVFDVSTTATVWSSWFGNLTFGAVWNSGATDTTSEIYDMETTGLDYHDYEWILKAALDNYDALIYIGHLGQGNSSTTLQNIKKVYDNPAKLTCVVNCSAASFNSKEFINAITSNTSSGNGVRFNVTGNSSWGNSQEKLYFIVYNVSNTNHVYSSTDGSTWTLLYTSSSVQYDTNGTRYNAVFPGNVSKTGTVWFRLDKDFIPPIITSPLFNTTSINPNDPVRFNVTVTDDVSVDTVWATFLYPNTTSINKTCSLFYTSESWTCDDQESSEKEVIADYNLDSTSRTCDSTWGFDCGILDASESDNTMDTCSNNAGDAWSKGIVQDVYINATAVKPGDGINVTCEFYNGGNAGFEYYIYYNNGTSWVQKASGSTTASTSNLNYSTTFTANNVAGTHWVRCIHDYDGENDECASVGSYYDNDDANFTVASILDNEGNSSFTTYTSIDNSNFDKVTEITVKTQVSYYDPTGSSSASNTRPDLEIGIYDGSAYKTGSYYNINNTMGSAAANTTDTNFTVTTTNSTILNAWKTSSNRKVEFRGIFIDTESGNKDTINWTAVWANISYGNATNYYIYDWTDTSQTGTYNVTNVYANDTTGNLNSTTHTNVYFTVAAAAAAPQWSNNGSNTTTPTPGAAVLLYTNWTDDADLGYAWLATNETGVWSNKTAYGSPIDINLTAGQTWSNFTWQNTSITSGAVAWKIYANDSAGNQNVTSEMTFTISACSIALGLSTNLSAGILYGALDPGTTANATGNNVSGITQFSLQIDNTGCNANVWIKANADLTKSTDIIGIGNVTFRNSTSDNTVESSSYTRTSLIYQTLAYNLAAGTNYVYLKFNMTVPSGQAPGTYNNTVYFLANRTV